MKAAATSRLVSKFVATYDKLFEGYTPEAISPHETPVQFWSNLLSLNVDRHFLGQKLRGLAKDDLLVFHKPFINTLFSTCLYYIRNAQYDDSKKHNAIETLSIVIRCILEKQPAGWEVMEIFAGGVRQSDAVFLNLSTSINMVLSDTAAPVELRHRILQLAVVFACSINQLSPGAYLLRRNFFPAIVNIIKSPETQEFTFEASLLLCVVANFHRTDAAKLNPYLRCIKEVQDKEMLRKLCQCINFTMDAVIKDYRRISDDSPPTFATSVGNLLASFRPDRALSPTPVDPPRELFKNQPGEAAVIMLPMHDFLHSNIAFNAILLEPLMSDIPPADAASNLPPLVYTFLSFSSYLLTHASSVQSPRATSYAYLSLVTLLHLAENDVAMSALLQPQQGKSGIRLCRQRPLLLPLSTSTRPVLCSLLDCCVLWLRHNLHKRIEIQSYLTCIWILHRIIWFLSRTRRRIDYHWEELWRSLIGLLDFLSSKLSDTDKVEVLIQETIILLAYSLCHAESYLGTPQAVHQLVYELIRSSSSLQKQEPLCRKKIRLGSKAKSTVHRPGDYLQRMLDTITHYEKKVQESGTDLSSATSVLSVIAKDVEAEGLFGGKEKNDDDPPVHSDNLGEIGFMRFACSDGLALMPGPDS